MCRYKQLWSPHIPITKCNSLFVRREKSSTIAISNFALALGLPYAASALPLAAGMGTMKSLVVLLCFTSVLAPAAQASKFWDDLYVNFGEKHVKYPALFGKEVGDVVDLALDNTTGSGFRSKWPFLYGSLGMKVKLVGGNSAGTVTSYYLASTFEKWCEVDFEFLGNETGQPYILQTNVFSEGKGEREQRIYLWFDPTTDYHYYGILWNQYFILFYVDDVVIRVFHNSKDLGIPYLEYQPMYIYSSIWNGESWATRGGAVKTDWSLQPFVASYQDFSIDSCVVKGHGEDVDSQDVHKCYEKLYSSWYGQPSAGKLTNKQVDDLKRTQYRYIIYDYCTDFERFPTPPRSAPETGLRPTSIRPFIASSLCFEFDAEPGEYDRQ